MVKKRIQVIIEKLDAAHRAHACVIGFRSGDSLTTEAINGLQAHVIVRHREEPEWALAQTVQVLAVGHAIAHANGATHAAPPAASPLSE